MAAAAVTLSKSQPGIGKIRAQQFYNCQELSISEDVVFNMFIAQ